MLDRDAAASVRVRPESSGFGAEITGVDLTRPLPPAELAQVRQAWIDHGVVAFPDQPLSLEALEAFTLQIGPFGDDPYVAPMPGHPNVLELRREPDEKAPNFGGGWHSDWSFQVTPPSATILRSEVIPPVGGDTLFVDAERAYDDLSETMKALLAPLRAIHSATRPYGAQGMYAKETVQRTMKILYSEEADKQHSHPLVRTHGESGRKALYVSPTYTIGIEGLTEMETDAVLGFLYKHLLQPKYQYRHKWRPGMVLMWDNRRSMHFAEGGYDGHLRVMHRTTVRGEVPV